MQQLPLRFAPKPETRKPKLLFSCPPIHLIAYNRVSDRGQVRPDLMCSPRLRMDLEQGETVESLQHQVAVATATRPPLRLAGVIENLTNAPHRDAIARALLRQSGVGWGNPAERGPLMVLLDVKDGFVSAGRRARDDNGVAY